MLLLDEAVAVGGFCDLASRGQGSKARVEGRGPGFALGVDFGGGHGFGCLGKDTDDPLVDGLRLCDVGCRPWSGHLQCESGVFFDQFQRDWSHGRRGAVLHGENEVFSIASQIQVGVPPGVELR